MTSRNWRLLLLDIGNTHSHVGVANRNRVLHQSHFSTREWFTGKAGKRISALLERVPPVGAAFCSVVPRANPLVIDWARQRWGIEALRLTARNVTEIGLDYPRPDTIGADRLANAIAACRHYGAPVVAIDFGTALTLDVVDRRRSFVGGVIAPGLAVMTDYLHEKTAQLPRIEIKDARSVIGKNTEDAMRAGAVVGYVGLVRELLRELRKELGYRRLAVVATGGYASLMAKRLPEIQTVDPLLTLEGVRLHWVASQAGGAQCGLDSAGGSG